MKVALGVDVEAHNFRRGVAYSDDPRAVRAGSERDWDRGNMDTSGGAWSNFENRNIKIGALDREPDDGEVKRGIAIPRNYKCVELVGRVTGLPSV
jgi:hypothetical protein